MSTFVAVLVILAVVSTLVVLIGTEVERHDDRAAAAREQARIRHEQFLAERRLQRLTGQALQAMLQSARSAHLSNPSHSRREQR